MGWWGTIAGLTFYKRLTLVARDRSVEKVFYPVYPPDENAAQVLEWLHARVMFPSPAFFRWA